VVGIHVSADGRNAAMIELNSETDFVAKNDDFLKLASDLAALVVERNPADVEALSALPMAGTTVDEYRKSLIGRIGENMSIRRFARIEAKGRIASYLHGGAKIGVLVDLVGGDETLAKDLAMHIAASKPKALSKEGVPAEEVERERSIASQKAAESGKPAEIVAKMVEGTVQKFLKEVTLLGQIFVKDPDGKQTIEQLLKARSAQVAAFTLYVVGEGIEKKQTDFAAEVAAQAAAAAGR
jgi:elongation factor Ts